MADRHTVEQRKANMSAVRSRGNKSTEIVFISLLRKNGMNGWRRHYPIEGTPDFVFPEKQIAVFIDGCFWHKCPKCYKCPASNKQFWENKVEDNRKRDTRQRRILRKNGWRVVRVWEHELKNNYNAVINKMKNIYNS